MNYRTPLPPISELAALAANIQTEKTADGKIRMAIEIWESVHEHHRQFNECADQVQVLKRKYHADKVQEMNLRCDMKLDHFLREVFPNSKPEDRKKWLRDYIKSCSRGFLFNSRIHPEISSDQQAQVDTYAETWLAGWRENGVDDPYAHAGALIRYRDNQGQQTRQTRAKNAVAEKNSKKLEKSPLSKNEVAKNAPSKSKRAPSKKNPPQAKNSNP